MLVSWQVTIRHENDVTHSYFQFNSLKFNSACFAGMNDDRLSAPKLHKSKLVGLNNKHLFQIYWESVHVSVCVIVLYHLSYSHSFHFVCVCVSLPVFEHKVGLWDLCWSPDLLVHRVGAAVILMSRWLEWRRRDGVCVCVCVCVFGFLGVLFSLFCSGMAALPSEGHWFGQDRHSVTRQTTARQGHSNPSSFYSKQDRLGRRSVGGTGCVKSFPYCPLSMEKKLTPGTESFDAQWSFKDLHCFTRCNRPFWNVTEKALGLKGLSSLYLMVSSL